LKQGTRNPVHRLLSRRNSLGSPCGIETLKASRGCLPVTWAKQPGKPVQDWNFLR